MPPCSECGQLTQLFADGQPLCLKCDGADPEELRIRRKLKESPPPALIQHQTREPDGSQIALLRLLEIDLDLGFTLLKIAKTEAKANPIHSKVALGRSHSALGDIRRLVSALENTDAAEQINGKANELEGALNAFPG